MLHFYEFKFTESMIMWYNQTKGSAVIVVVSTLLIFIFVKKVITVLNFKKDVSVFLVNEKRSVV